ncbi:hypothetical protein ACTWPT_41755 [Nonomuraea sp. 3N208]|uniref:hypothetical protein n=1 Tax=Nonomuraea sp. 3N208 TaxID=3457421 RepID=UPI003FD2E619
MTAVLPTSFAAVLQLTCIGPPDGGRSDGVSPLPPLTDWLLLKGRCRLLRRPRRPTGEFFERGRCKSARKSCWWRILRRNGSKTVPRAWGEVLASRLA